MSVTLDNRSGANGVVTFNGIPVPVRNWTVNQPNLISTFRNTMTGEIPNRAPGFNDAAVSFVMDFNFVNNNFQSGGGGVRSGAFITNVVLVLDGTDSTPLSWTFLKLIVASVQNDFAVADPNNGILLRVNCQLSGKFFYPGDTVTA